MRRTLAIVLALFALVYVLARVRYAPPEPLSADAPAERFSAARARAVQARLVGDGATRYLGTPGNARGRAVLVAELTRLGWAVEEQRAWSCTQHGTCGPVTNVIAKLAGTEPALPVVLMTAHHDSAPVSPGASDDGLGVAAVLEAARALSAGPRPERGFAVVLTDGEEAGLLGASAFVREHPLARSVGASTNVDARGSRGPSRMFETSPGNARLVALLAARLPRPVTTSLFFEVYRRMPNDTDFTLTKALAPGVNFANTAGIEHYHTPLDDLDASSPGTLQQHGDSVLATARAFADDLPAVGEADAVWFDVLALGIVRWPSSWSMPLAVIALVLVAVHGLRARAIDRGVLVFFASLGAAVLGAVAAGFLLDAAGALPAPFALHPLPAIAAVDLAAVGASAFVMRLVARASSPRGRWTGTWLGWGSLGVLTAGLAPGASYLFVVPTLAAAIVGPLLLDVAVVVPAIVAAVLVLALEVGVYDTVGLAAPAVVALPVALLATTLAPALAGGVGAPLRRAPLAIAAGALACVLGAALAPKFSPAFPQRANVVFRQDEGGARVSVDTTWGPSTWGAAPAPMLAAIGEAREVTRALPWTMRSTSAPAPRVALPSPTAEVISVEDDGRTRRVRARLASPRGASSVAMVLPAGRRADVKVEGQRATPVLVDGGAMVAVLAMPASGVAVEIDTSAGPLPITLLDRSFDVPPGTSAEAAVRARPANAVPSQDGDQTVTEVSLSL